MKQQVIVLSHKQYWAYEVDTSEVVGVFSSQEAMESFIKENPLPEESGIEHSYETQVWEVNP